MQLVSEAPHKHLLILDTNVCINDIDLFEMKCPATALIVILQARDLMHLPLRRARVNRCARVDCPSGGATHRCVCVPPADAAGQ